MKRVLKSTLDLIGDTPILKLQKIVPENAAEVWLKYEAVNPTGFYKDRMAKSVLVNALKRGDVSQGDKVVEYTGGQYRVGACFRISSTWTQVLCSLFRCLLKKQAADNGSF